MNKQIQIVLTILLALMVIPAVSALTLSNPGSQTINENNNLQFDVAASDVNGSVTFTLINGPTGSELFNTTPTNARFNWTPTFDQADNHTITIRAQDATDTVNREVNITVNNVNREPVVSPETASFTLASNKDQEVFAVSASDPDGDSVTRTFTFNSSRINCDWSSGLRISRVGDWNGTTTCELSATDGTLSDTGVYTITVEPESKIEIEDIDLYWDNENEHQDLDDGETSESISPGQELILRVRIDNELNNEEMEDVRVRIDSEGDLESSLEDNEEDLRSVDDDDPETAEFVFDLESDMDEGTYRVTITVTGEDQNGNRHRDEALIFVKIEKERDEITITSMEVFPSSITCNTDSLRLEVEAENTGQRDQDEVRINIRVREFDYFDFERDIEIDEGEDWRGTFNIPIPSDTNPGRYFIEATAYYDEDEKTDDDTLVIQIPDCDGAQDEDTQDGGIDVNPDQGTTTPPLSGNVVYGETTPSAGEFFESPAYLLVLVLVIIVLVLAIILLAMKIFA